MVWSSGDSLAVLRHARSLIKVQGLFSVDNPVRLALICQADDPWISSQSSDRFRREAKQSTRQSVSVYSEVLCHDYLFHPIDSAVSQWHVI